ncbi:hypothetical protein ACIRPX_43255 [Streptomyces sp. NPDC101225]|uniref:hypothetical protein n=1 Tax=Streptomyces sp. NPDC101225 TaxID=3366135 RepID=UPI003810F61D
MAPTRLAAHLRPTAAPAVPMPPASAAVEGWAGPVDGAARLEVLLGDPRDPANPYGRAALWAAGYDALPAPPAGLPGSGRGRPCADGLARALRPLFCRDLALAHAWSIRPPAGAPAPDGAGLLAPAALLASAGGILRTTARIVAGLSRHDPAAGQWHPVLAGLFAELLACESLVALALRSCPRPGCPRPGRPGPRPAAPAAPAGEGEGLEAVVGYVVPQLAGELLDDLELVLNECGFGAASVEQRMLARLAGSREGAGAGWRAARGAQARLARALPRRAGPHPDPATAPAVGGAAVGPAADAAADAAAGVEADLAALFRITVRAPALACGGLTWRALAQSLPATATATACAGDGGDGGGGGGGEGEALVRAGRRLLVEQRALRAASAAAHAAGAGPADPAVRALADRQALLVLAAAVLGVRRAAAGDGPRFLGRSGWALVALGRITERLGLAPVHHAPDPRPGVWQELARRADGGADCDLYATRLLW